MTTFLATTLIKWWCNCIDLCFEIVVRPWEKEELPYRRMICAVFGQPWKLKKSYPMFEKWLESNNRPMPSGWAGTRKAVTEFTRAYWNWDDIRCQITPKWSKGTIDYLEEFFAKASEDLADKQIAQAFRMINEVGEKFVPKPLIAEKLGVLDKGYLYGKIDNFAWHLRCRENAVLKSFAIQGQTPPPDTVIYWWREDRKLIAFEVRIQEWGGEVPHRFLDLCVDDQDFSVRTYNCLRNANIQTIGELLYKTEAEMLRVKNLGRKSLEEIKEFLHGLDPALELGILYLREKKSRR